MRKLTLALMAGGYLSLAALLSLQVWRSGGWGAGVTALIAGLGLAIAAHSLIGRLRDTSSNNRDFAARWLGVTPDKVRFIMPDVGGGFGAKNMTYAEHALIPWAARRV